MSRVEVRIPELGDFPAVDVIEVHVKAGDKIAAEDPLVTLETDKATMDVPAPRAGTVLSVAIKNGDKVAAGDLVLMLDAADEPAARSAPSAAAAADAAAHRRRAPAPRRRRARAQPQAPSTKPCRPAANALR